MIHLPLAPRTVRPAQTARILRAVLRPFTGGLHCGGMPQILAGPFSRVLLPFSGGLHCGKSVLALNMLVEWGAPAVQRRAPLRPVCVGRALNDHDSCSRGSTAGSIAAIRAASATSRNGS